MVSMGLIGDLQKKLPELAITTDANCMSIIVEGKAIDAPELNERDLLCRFHSLTELHQEAVLSSLVNRIKGLYPKKAVETVKAVEKVEVSPAVVETVVVEEPAPVVEAKVEEVVEEVNSKPVPEPVLEGHATTKKSKKA